MYCHKCSVNSFPCIVTAVESREDYSVIYCEFTKMFINANLHYWVATISTMMVYCSQLYPIFQASPANHLYSEL